MNRTKYLKGSCQHCGGRLEFLADHIGMTVPCPHCKQETELLLSAPPEEPTLPRRTLIWTGIAVVVLGLGFGGALIALKRAQRWAESQKKHATAESVPAVEVSTNSPTPEAAQTSSADSLAVSGVTLEKTPGSSLVYAVGTLKNSSTRQRFGIKVELELRDASDKAVGIASDYRQVLEPGAEWKFKALVVDSKTAVSAKVSSIREDQ
jgi:hypothetical protein